jgi:hypothetical protein
VELIIKDVPSTISEVFADKKPCVPDGLFTDRNILAPVLIRVSLTVIVPEVRITVESIDFILPVLSANT